MVLVAGLLEGDATALSAAETSALLPGIDVAKAPEYVKMLQTASRAISEKLGCNNYPIQIAD